jgi:UDP-perosamine 4-acetyltransferase
VTPLPLVLVGAGGHAKVVIEAARAGGRFRAVGLIDPAPPALAVLGVPVLGGDEVLARLRAEGVAWAFAALGSNAARERVGDRLRAAGFRLATLVHPGAEVMPSARLGEGVVAMARAVVSAEARVDDLAIVNTGAVVEHDGRIGTAAHVAPLAALAGNVRVGARAGRHRLGRPPRRVHRGGRGGRRGLGRGGGRPGRSHGGWRAGAAAHALAPRHGRRSGLTVRFVPPAAGAGADRFADAAGAAAPGAQGPA